MNDIFTSASKRLKMNWGALREFVCTLFGKQIPGWREVTAVIVFVPLGLIFFSLTAIIFMTITLIAFALVFIAVLVVCVALDLHPSPPLHVNICVLIMLLGFPALLHLFGYIADEWTDKKTGYAALCKKHTDKNE